MAPRRGRPRRTPYALSTRHGTSCLRIYLPGGGDARISVPVGWTPEQTFAAWLRGWLEEHPELSPPDPWRLYLTDESGPRLPGRAVVPHTVATARHALAHQLALPAPPPPVIPAPLAWHAAVARYTAALREGWHPPGPSGRARRPDSIPHVAGCLTRIGAEQGWRVLTDLDGAHVHAWILAAEARALRHGSISTWRSYLRALAIWAHQQGELPAGPEGWPRYSRRYTPREARCTVGDLDLAIEKAPDHLKSGAPFKVVLIVMRWTGIRRKGLARLPRQAFHLDADPPYIEIDPATDKTRTPRLVPLAPPAVAALRDWLGRRDYAPAELPFGRRLPDGSIHALGDGSSWTPHLDRLGIPRNLDGTAGLHRARKAALSAMLDRPGPASGGTAASWRHALGLTGISPDTLDSYYRRSTLTELDAAKLMPAAPHGRPVQLAFSFTPGGEIRAELRAEDGHIARATLPDHSEQRRRVLALVADIAAIASDGTAEKSGAPLPDRVGMAAWRKSASASFRRPRRSTVAGRGTR